jgi:hypothetical protein
MSLLVLPRLLYHLQVQHRLVVLYRGIYRLHKLWNRTKMGTSPSMQRIEHYKLSELAPVIPKCYERLQVTFELMILESFCCKALVNLPKGCSKNMCYVLLWFCLRYLLDRITGNSIGDR